MRFKCKEPIVLKAGMNREIKRFALFPTRVEGYTVWLESYIEIQCTDQKSLEDILYHRYRWYFKSKRLIGPEDTFNDQLKNSILK